MDNGASEQRLESSLGGLTPPASIPAYLVCGFAPAYQWLAKLALMIEQLEFEALTSEISSVVAQISRIVAELARLSKTNIGALPNSPLDLCPDSTLSWVQWFMRARRLRERYFGTELFADPAWDMLLDLFASELCGFRTSVSSLCLAGGVPPTTAFRWVNALVEKGTFLRHEDPLDGRRAFVELSPNASEAMKSYFGEVVGSPIVKL